MIEMNASFKKCYFFTNNYKFCAVKKDYKDISNYYLLINYLIIN